ncbi:MAG TPA: hypothetical protein VII23_03740 [Terriglobales bacterium]
MREHDHPDCDGPYAIQIGDPMIGGGGTPTVIDGMSVGLHLYSLVTKGTERTSDEAF